LSECRNSLESRKKAKNGGINESIIQKDNKSTNIFINIIYIEPVFIVHGEWFL